MNRTDLNCLRKVLFFSILLFFHCNISEAQWRPLQMYLGHGDSSYLEQKLILGRPYFRIGNFDSNFQSAKFDIKSDELGLPVLLLNNQGIGSIKHLFLLGSNKFGIYQTGDSLLNYFEGKIGCQSSLSFTGSSNGIRILSEQFPFTFIRSPGASEYTPVRLFQWGAQVAKLECDTFLLHDNSGLGKILVSDQNGKGTWTNASLFNDNDWLETREFGDNIDPPPSAQKSLYLNPIYWNVGIGTDNPKSMLHVVDGNIMISRSPSKAPGSKNGSILFGEVITDQCPRGEWGIEYNSPDSTSVIDSTYSGGGLNFWKVYTEGHDNHGFNYALYLRNDGNVGIGTPVTYGYKLAVTGKVLCEELKVKLVTQWPDYVLNPDHKLLSLNELDHFIKENNRLPDLPSAKEVEEKGINVGEMNGVLLKKIEELTVYIIAMQKEMDQLKAKISGQ